MTQTEFLKTMESWGVVPSKLSIFIGECCGWEGAHGVYERDGHWFLYEADGRGHISEDMFPDEESAFEELFRKAQTDLRSFTNRFVTREIAKLPKTTVFAWLKERYDFSDQLCETSWNKLCTDLKILFEFKHYIATGTFVPEKFCQRVEGYSAEELYNHICLEVPGAFLYLIYLEEKPKEALENLRKGLPRRRLFQKGENDRRIK